MCDFSCSETLCCAMIATGCKLCAIYYLTDTCDAGTELKNFKCVLCPRGKYSDGIVQETCVDCPAGRTTAGEKATSIKQCNQRECVCVCVCVCVCGYVSACVFMSVAVCSDTIEIIPICLPLVFQSQCVCDYMLLPSVLVVETWISKS